MSKILRAQGGGDTVWTQTRMRLLDAFRAIDADGSGSVSREELQRKIQALNISDGGGGVHQPSAEAVALAKYLMAAADKDGDDQLSFKEFRNHFDQSEMHRHEERVVHQRVQSRAAATKKTAPVRYGGWRDQCDEAQRGDSAEDGWVGSSEGGERALGRRPPQNVLRRMDGNQEPPDEIRQRLRSVQRPPVSTAPASFGGDGRFHQQAAVEAENPNLSERPHGGASGGGGDGGRGATSARDKYRGKARTGETLKNHLHHVLMLHAKQVLSDFRKRRMRACVHAWQAVHARKSAPIRKCCQRKPNGADGGRTRTERGSEGDARKYDGRCRGENHTVVRSVPTQSNSKRSLLQLVIITRTIRTLTTAVAAQSLPRSAVPTVCEGRSGRSAFV